jgi:hypothetical protein
MTDNDAKAANARDRRCVALPLQWQALPFPPRHVDSGPLLSGMGSRKPFTNMGRNDSGHLRRGITRRDLISVIITYFGVQAPLQVNSL